MIWRRCTWFTVAVSAICQVLCQYAPPSEVVNSMCDLSTDIYMVNELNDKSGRSYLKCQPMGSGNKGFWKRKTCPFGDQFEYMEQSCSSQTQNQPQSQPSASQNQGAAFTDLALIGQSCAGGETCLGGAICDLMEFTCLCPVGSKANMASFVCEAMGPTDRPLPGTYPNTFTNTPQFPTFYTTPQPLPTRAPYTRFPSTFMTFTTPRPTIVYTQQPTTFRPFTRQRTTTTTTTLPPPIRVAPGSNCRNRQICSGGSFCNNRRGICECPETLIVKNGKCVADVPVTAQIGQSCEGRTVCLGKSTCLNAICQCEAPLEQQGNQCLPKKVPVYVGAGDACGGEEICSKGSVCNAFAKKCMCPLGTVQKQNACIEGNVNNNKNAVGDSCRFNSDCVSGAYCNGDGDSARCVCLSTHVNIDGICFRVVRPGQSGCDFDGQCSAIYTGARCQSRECVCPEGMLAVDQTCKTKQDHEYVSNLAFPGDVCSTASATLQCMSSKCIKGYCACGPDTVLFAKQCVHAYSFIVPLGHNCTIHSQCIQGAKCIRSSCQCPLGTLKIGSKCQIRPTLRSMSNSGRQIFWAAAPSVRTNKIVKDPQTFNTSAQELLATPAGFFCVPNQVICALGKGTCVLGVCTCKRPLLSSKGKCVRRSLPMNIKIISTSTSASAVTPERTAELLSVLSKMKSKIQCKSPKECPQGALCASGVCQCVSIQEFIVNNSCVQITSSSEVARQLTTALPRTICTTDADCGTGGRTCTDSQCSCPPGTTNINNDCVSSTAYIPIGQSCAAFESCSGGAECVDRFCQCTAGSVEKNGLCEQAPGGRCTAGQICVAGSSCQFGVCKCLNGQTPVDNLCPNMQAAPGESCEKGEHCTGGSNCYFGVCNCPSDQSIVGNICQQAGLAYPGDSCAFSQICQGGSYCKNSVCACPNNQVVINRQCVDASGLPPPGATCLPQQQCSGGSSCINGKCTCPVNTVIQGQQCVQSGGQSQPGSQCSVNQQACAGNAICIFQVCRCQRGYTIDRTTRQCRPTSRPAQPGMACGTNQLECTQESTCVQNVCQCFDNLIVINGQCAVLSGTAAPGQSCAGQQACTGGSTCSLGICTCPQSYTISGATCVLDPNVILPGQSCNPAADRCSGGSSCQQNICQCPTGQVVSASQCVAQDVLPGRPCTPDQQCLGGSTCLRGICTCPTSYIDVDGHCLPSSASPGSSCVLPQTCSGLSSCVSGVCQCQTGFQVVQGICQPRNSVNPGQPCRNNEICGGGSSCNQATGICECPNGQSISGSRCVSASSTARPGETCSLGEICTGGSTCAANRVCTCPQDTILVNFQCVGGTTGPSPGSACIQQGATCTGGAQCINLVCQCPTRAPVIEQNICKVQPGQICAVNQQPCAGGSTCQGTICMCPVGTVSSGNQCVQQGIGPKPGEFCTTGQTCTGGAFCSQNRCQCPTGYTIVNQQCQRSSPAPGEICNIGDACSGGSFCSQGRCQCPAGTTQINQQCLSAGLPGKQCGPSQQCSGGSYCAGDQKCTCPIGTSIINNQCIRDQSSTSPPGGSCANGQQCTGGSFCSQSICTCQFGQTVVSGQCTSNPTNTSPPGGPCGNGQTCSGGSSCNLFSRVCQCPSGSKIVNGMCSTQTERPPGSPCLPTDICGGGSVCQGFVCTCPAGSQLQGSQCVSGASMAKPGQTCSSSIRCSGGSSCIQGVCQCSASQTISGEQCKTASVPNGSCSQGQICTGGSVCNGAQCKCPYGSSPYNNVCYVFQIISRPGASCQGSRICVGNAICQYAACVCPPGSNPIADECLMPTSNVNAGGSCSYSYQCSPGLMCMYGICKCLATNKRLTPVCAGAGQMTSPPGGSCAATQQCTGGSTCKDGWCVCPDENQVVENGLCKRIATKSVVATTMATTIRNPVIKTAGPGSSCDENTQCMSGSKCIRSQCQCAVGAIIVAGQCIFEEMLPTTTQVAILRPLDACTTLGQRCSGGSICDGSMCSCPMDQVVMNGQCESPVMVPPESMCSPPMTICGGGSRCQQNKCHCPSHSPMNVNGVCTEAPKPQPTVRSVESSPFAGPSEPCDLMTTCTGGSVCNAANNRCECPKGSIEGDNKCIAAPQPKAQTPPPQPQPVFAVPGTLCAIPNTECVGGSVCNTMSQMCECLASMIIVGDSCEPAPSTSAPTQPAIVQRMSECESDLECAMNKYCDNGKCRCQPGHISNADGDCISLDRTRTLMRQSSSSNDRTEDLSNNEPESVEGKCPANRTPLKDRNTGLFVTCDPKKPSLTCTPLSYCYVTGSVAESSTPMPAPLIRLGDLCFNGELCGLHAECRDGFCHCMEGFRDFQHECIPDFVRKSSSGSVLYAVPGDRCTPSHKCLGGSICHLGSCVCPYFTRSRNMRCFGSLDPEAFSSPGDPCARVDDCIGGSECSNGFCICPKGTQSVNMQCVATDYIQLSSPGNTCVRGTSCTGRSYCYNGKCVCPASMNNRNGVCVPESDDTNEANAVVLSTKVMPDSAMEQSVLTEATTVQEAPLSEETTVLSDIATDPTIPELNVSNEPMTPSTTTKHLVTSPEVFTTNEPRSTTLLQTTHSISQQSSEQTEATTLEPAMTSLKEEESQNTEVPATLPVQTTTIRTMQATEARTSPSIVPTTRLTTTQTTQPPTTITTTMTTPRSRTTTPPRPQLRTTTFSATQSPLERLAAPGYSCANGQACISQSICDLATLTCQCPKTHTLLNGGCEIEQAGSTTTPTSTVKQAVVLNNSTRKSGRWPSYVPQGYATPCPLPEDPSKCALPDCYCSKTGKTIPGGLGRADTPQIVVLSFDDPINEKNMKVYKQLFDGRYTNPNGCPYKATFFVSHEWTDYADVQELHQDGHEMASNSVSHVGLGRKKIDRWVAEMDGMRKMLVQFADVPSDEVVGIRAPTLSIGDIAQFKMMKQEGFNYDNSLSANPGRAGEPYWPQTLDFKLPWRCENDKCPRKSFSGLWTIPLNHFYGYYLPSLNGYKRSSMVRAAISANDTATSTENMLWQNFKRAYSTNRAPYVLSLNADFLFMLEDEAGTTALHNFLEKLSADYPDVWVMTMAQLVEWMRSPKSLREMHRFAPTQCHQGKARRQPRTCETRHTCRYITKQMTHIDHRFQTCAPCPESYPWIYNPTGDQTPTN